MPTAVLINLLLLVAASLLALKDKSWDLDELSVDALSFVTGALVDRLENIGTPPIKYSVLPKALQVII